MAIKLNTWMTRPEADIDDLDGAHLLATQTLGGVGEESLPADPDTWIEGIADDNFDIIATERNLSAGEEIVWTLEDDTIDGLTIAKAVRIVTPIEPIDTTNLDNPHSRR
jgi:hypothetical protein